MPRAVWKETVLAESDSTVVVEDNHYFPPESVDWKYFKKSDHSTTCHWKGRASYYHLHVKGFINTNGAWYYPSPLPAAAEIKDRVAFWHGVTVEG